MASKQHEFTMHALGRPAFLGQLYNATTEYLLNTQFFDEEALRKTQDVPNMYTYTEYQDVSSLSERARALDISAELSASILGGMISLSGSGQYLDTSKSRVTSREVSIVCGARKVLKRLDLANHYVRQTVYDKVVKLGATHVVTGIVYGGTLVANFTEKDSSSDSQTKVHGGFSASFMKGMAKIFSVEGKAAVDSNDQANEALQSYDFKVYADFSSTEHRNPTTIGDVLGIVNRWTELVGGGVACDIILTPISQFIDGSPEGLMLYELERHELHAILNEYDRLFRLSGKRAQLVASLEHDSDTLFPTFLDVCRERKNKVDEVLSRARKALSEYLINFRSGGRQKVGEANEFLRGIRDGYAEDIRVFEEDESRSKLLLAIKALASDRNVPLIDLDSLRRNMTQVARGAVGVVLIPPFPNLNGAINTFDVLVKSIREWRAEEDKQERPGTQGESIQTIFISFFADPALHAELLKLDGPRGALKKGLDEALREGAPCFLHYGLLPTVLARADLDWSLLNDEGWAFLKKADAGAYYYVGQVKGGKRHGRGTITYADGSTYSGDWWNDRRHGLGELVEGDSQRTTGVFIEDQYRSDGILVDLTIYARNRIPIAAHKIPLRKHDATTSHVLKIGTMLGWRDANVFRLTVESKLKEFEPLQMDVKGKMLKPGEDDELYTASWKLDKGLVELKAEKLR